MNSWEDVGGSVDDREPAVPSSKAVFSNPRGSHVVCYYVLYFYIAKVWKEFDGSGLMVADPSVKTSKADLMAHRIH